MQQLVNSHSNSNKIHKLLWAITVIKIIAIIKILPAINLVIIWD